MSIFRYTIQVFIVLTAICASTVAAKDNPPITPNRVVCPSMKALLRAIELLPNVDAIKKNSTLPPEGGQPDKKTGAPGCSWLGGKTPIPTENPFGWVYAGEYIALINGLDVGDGRKFLIASVVVSRREWRLEDDCAAVNFTFKTVLPTGDSYRFFGAQRKGFDPFCRNLVNTFAEADALNAPRRSFSEVWKSRPYWRTMIACSDIDGLTNSLDRMVNEQQVNNSDRATFGRKDRCTFRPVDEIVASRFMGLYKTVPINAGGPSFVVEVHEVVHAGRRDGELTTSLMASNPTRSRLLRLEPACQRPISVPTQGLRSVYLMGTNLRNVASVSIKTPFGERELEPLMNTPVGISACETDTKIYNAG